MKVQRRVQAYRALDTLLGEAVRQSTQIETQLAPVSVPGSSVVNREGNDHVRCPGCGKAVARRIHGPARRPACS
jgi:hypothetical protein